MRMCTCTCMSCIYSMSWIHRYMYVSIPSPSRHHLARCQRQICNISHAMMVICLSWFPWTSPPRPQRNHVRQPRVPPRNVRHSSDPWGEKSNLLFWRGKIVTSKRRGLTSPPQEDHYWNGKGTGIKGTRRFPWAFLELFPETKGTHTAVAEPWRPTSRQDCWWGISRTNVDCQWNPVYNAFHRFFCWGNETIRR